MMRDERDPGSEAPPTRTAGDVGVPPRRPPTAVGADAFGEPPAPAPRPHAVTTWTRTREVSILPGVAAFVGLTVREIDRGLGQLDPLADRVAGLLGLRRPPSTHPGGE
jgi:hypothetical protein